jgi:hypothetical protein
VGLVDERDSNLQDNLAVGTVPQRLIVEVEVTSAAVREAEEVRFKALTGAGAALRTLATVAPVAGRVFQAVEEVVAAVAVVVEEEEVEAGAEAEAGAADSR